MSRNKKILVNMLVVFVLVAIILRVSYAFFTANISGSENSTSVTLNSGLLTIAYAGGDNITISNIYPQDDPVASKMFTLTSNNTTALNMPYTLNLVVDSNSFSNNAISYTLDSTNTNDNGVVAGSIDTPVTLLTGASSNTIGNGHFVNGTNKIHTYVLNIYFKDTDTIQNEDQGKSFTAHVSISSQMAT